MGWRTIAGALAFDWPRFELALHGWGAYRSMTRSWIAVRNRNERLTLDGRGARCEWMYTSDLHIGRVFPSSSARLMSRAFHDWPVRLLEKPSATDDPKVSFVIGHRGLARLPHLLMTLSSIAGQTDVPVECVVVEQSVEREIATMLPSWVRYVHTPIEPGYDYNRSWTLNAGAAAAEGEVLILHDNDMVCPAGYAAETLARFREGWLFQQPKRFTFYLDEEETTRAFTRGAVSLETRSTVVQNLHGASIAASREAYFAIGGFDQSFVGWGGEDNEFWERAETSERVYAFGYLPFIHLWHAPQKGKTLGGEAPALQRYHDIKAIPPQERIRRLRAQT